MDDVIVNAVKAADLIISGRYERTMAESRKTMSLHRNIPIDVLVSLLHTDPFDRTILLLAGMFVNRLQSKQP